MIDTRREANQIARQFNRFQNTIGEGALWFMFDTEGSTYSRVYDEGYRRYHAPRRVPLLWVDQQESAADYSPEGRRPTARIRLAFGAKSLWESGINVTEAHGTALHAFRPSTVWNNDRINDVLYYGGHFYAISSFQIKGRVKYEDVIVGITGIEIFPDDEMNLDVTPRDWFAPHAPTEPEPVVVGSQHTHIYFGDDPPTDQEVGDFWFDPVDVIPGDVIAGYDLDNPIPYGANAPENPQVGSFWLDTEPDDDD